MIVASVTVHVKEEHIHITRRKGVRLRVAYEVRKPMFGNLDVIPKDLVESDLERRDTGPLALTGL